MHERNSWHESAPSIFHALGGIGNRAYTNSKEAFLENYKNGARVFEADFSVTKDGVLVLAHDWENFCSRTGLSSVPTVEDFKKAKIDGLYTPVTSSELVALMCEFPDVYIVTDKFFGQENAQLMEILLISEISKMPNPEDIFNRFIIQIYDEENFYTIDAIHHWKNYIFTLYAHGDKTFEKDALFALKNRIPVITMWDFWVLEKDVSPFLNAGLKIYAHTVNDSEEVKKLQEKGAWGIYTDFLQQE